MLRNDRWERAVCMRVYKPRMTRTPRSPHIEGLSETWNQFRQLEVICFILFQFFFSSSSSLLVGEKNSIFLVIVWYSRFRKIVERIAVERWYVNCFSKKIEIIIIMEKRVFKKRRERNKILSFLVNVVFHRKLQRAEESRSPLLIFNGSSIQAKQQLQRASGVKSVQKLQA